MTKRERVKKIEQSGLKREWLVISEISAKKKHEALKRDDRKKGDKMGYINKSEPVRHGVCVCVCMYVCIWGVRRLKNEGKKLKSESHFVKMHLSWCAFNLVSLLKCNSIYILAAFALFSPASAYLLLKIKLLFSNLSFTDFQNNSPISRIKKTREGKYLSNIRLRFRSLAHAYRI